MFCDKCGNKIDLKSENKSDVSMILGIVSLILTFFCIFFSLPLSIIGLILGISQRKKFQRKI